MFCIDFSNQAKKFLRKCEMNLRIRIIKKIKLLKLEPVPHKAVSIVGEAKTFRIRVGDYRILYEIKWNKKKILIVKIDKRPRVYG